MLGSARLLTDGTGATKGTRSFKAFGETRTLTGETTDAGYVGTLGIETDSNGFLFMRNRYYDTGMGRFVQMDPIGLRAGDVNVYRYCGNDGINKMDPSGFKKIQICVPLVSYTDQETGKTYTIGGFCDEYDYEESLLGVSWRGIKAGGYDPQTGVITFYILSTMWDLDEGKSYIDEKWNTQIHEAAHKIFIDKYGTSFDKKDAKRAYRITEIMSRMAEGKDQATAERETRELYPQFY